MRVHNALRALTDAEENLTARQIDMMLLVATLPREQCTIRGLAAEMNVSKPAATRAADALEFYGWANRKPDLLDRRSVFIVPTPKGRAAIAPLLALEPAAVPVREAA